MTAAHAVAVVLALAVAAASMRMLLAAHRGDVAARPRAWRIAALLSLKVIAAALLYLTLLPPSRPVEAGTMVVLTERATQVEAAGARDGEHVVALPEARSGDPRAAPAGRVPRTDDGAGRVPDLATALRRTPGATRLRIVGAGLTARDRDAAHGRALSFAPAPLPRGIVELWWPDRVQAGAALHVRGRVDGVAKGTAELIDPAGRRVDRAALAEDGRFMLTGEARSAGLFAFHVRVREANGALVEEAAVPLRAISAQARRVLLLSGAPSPESKFLRRWAADAGLSPHAEYALGGGLRTGDAPLAFDAATLATFDLAILDERALQALSAARYDALRAAVRDGLGALLRITGPLSAQGRARLRGLGLTVGSARLPATVRLAAQRQVANAENDEAADGKDGAGDDGTVPALTRRAVRVDAADASPLLRDADGAALATWRAEGRGRVAAWLLGDSFRLVLAGDDERHARLWSDAAGVLMRARGGREPTLEGEARQGQRVVLCGIASDSAVETPDGLRAPLLQDPASGASRCAGFWPTSPGWHHVRHGDEAWPFHVAARDALPGVQARVLHDATAALARASAAPPVSAASAPGPRWPWFLAWLVASAMLWWLERARYGRGSARSTSR